ncbi:26S proteasome non-ATPase regulatory subunit 10-like isoform X2 [Phymastichus coffea]|uniref:26S proteasome non-ATPase regulatory subunit 10-like isoform X2 n=1 Tax=Phymastichus coffea TaxID=108790 RepID=UPI00273C803B|nr:26S proteasome non-ATPase regulatory subunit 10-like isoform X2 [Phymastichus coffea]
MRYKKDASKNDRWTKTCQALKELLETLHCSKCKSHLHDTRQFLQCGHFSCFSCIKKHNKCIECHFSMSDDTVKDSSIKKIVQVCCTIAETIGFNKNNVHNFNQFNEKFENISKKRKGAKKFTEIVAKKPRLIEVIPPIRIPKNIDKKNHHGETKLHEECKKGHINNVRAFLDAGANPNTFCAAGWTPLQECADYGYIEIADLLLRKGADINKKGYLGRTPLHEATQANQFDMVKFLLDHNARNDIEDDSHNIPIEYCKSEQIRKMLTCNMENGSPHILRRTRKNSKLYNKICNNGFGISHNTVESNHNVSALNDIKVKECDNSHNESEDDVVSDEEKHSQNITIPHQDYAHGISSNLDNNPFDSEEIDVLN